MKHPIEKRSDRVMRYFTPELYQQFNSPDDEAADLANAAWERAIRDYRQHLKSIRHKLPPEVQSLAVLCLHDAEVLGFDEKVQSTVAESKQLGGVSPWQSVAILCLRQQETLYVLLYMLSDRTRAHPPVENWQFSGERRHWLYDELDLWTNQRERFLHRILLSDGRVLEIPFLSAIVSVIPLPAVNEASLSKRSA